MSKITLDKPSFHAIPEFTRWGSYEVDMPLGHLKEWIESRVNGRDTDIPLNMDPDFQRGHVWTKAQQIAYLEFFLQGGRTARVIYFNHSLWNDRRPRGDVGDEYKEFVVVDGKQRLQALMDFLNDKIRVFGYKYSEFIDKPGFSHNVKIHINDLRSRAEVLQWYIEFNAGGTPHSKAEIARVRELLTAEEAR